MAGPGDAAGREELYTERGQNGIVLARAFAFYPGAPTIPTSFVGNLILGVQGNGPGAYLLDGIGPPIRETTPCEDIIINGVVCTLVGDTLTVTALYNVLAGDIYILFNTTTGQVLQPTSVTPVVGGVDVVFDVTSPPAAPGAWSFKIMRVANPKDCFFVKPNCHVIVGCTISLLTLTGDGVDPNPPIFAGNSGTVALTGSGFLSGPLTVTIPVSFGDPGPFTVDVVNIIDDSNMTIDFTTIPANNTECGVRIELASDPTCFAEIGFVLDEGIRSFSV